MRVHDYFKPISRVNRFTPDVESDSMITGGSLMPGPMEKKLRAIFWDAKLDKFGHSHLDYDSMLLLRPGVGVFSHSEDQLGQATNDNLAVTFYEFRIRLPSNRKEYGGGRGYRWRIRVA